MSPNDISSIIDTINLLKNVSKDLERQKKWRLENRSLTKGETNFYNKRESEIQNSISGLLSIIGAKVEDKKPTMDEYYSKKLIGKPIDGILFDSEPEKGKKRGII